MAAERLYYLRSGRFGHMFHQLLQNLPPIENAQQFRVQPCDAIDSEYGALSRLWRSMGEWQRQLDVKLQVPAPECGGTIETAR